MPKPVPHLTLGKKQNQLFEGGRKVGKGQSSGHCPMMIQMTIRSPRCPRHADKCQPGVLHRLHPQHESSRLRTVGSEALVEMIQHNAARNTVPHSQSPWLQTDKANPSAWDKEANNSPPHPYPTPRRPLYRPAHLPRDYPLATSAFKHLPASGQWLVRSPHLRSCHSLCFALPVRPLCLISS